MGALLEGFTIQLRLLETFGSLMNPIIKNEEVNLQKVNSAWVSLGRPPTLRGLLEGEKGRGMHGRNGVLKDPSGAMALLWMRRMLQFTLCLFEAICASPTSNGTLTAVARTAYS